MNRIVYKEPLKLREKRKNRIETAIRQNGRPDRVPILSQAWTWKAGDAGLTLSEYFYDYEKRFDAVCQHNEKYEMDFYVDLGARNAFPVADCFGPSLYNWDDKTGALNLRDYALLDEDDYDYYLEVGPLRYNFEKGVPSRYGITDKKQMMEAYGKAAKEYFAMVDFNKSITKYFTQNAGVPICNKVQAGCPGDAIMSGMRGIAGLSIDMRRRPKKVKAVCDMTFNSEFSNVHSQIASYGGASDHLYATPVRESCLSHTVMNEKQFSEYIWPYMKRLVDDVCNTFDTTGILYFEGDTTHIHDFLKDIPKGHFMMMFEQDDPVYLKKTLPNMTIAGGYPSLLLHMGTPEENIDKAKELIDKLFYDGAYVLSTDKMLTGPADAEGSNLKVVIETVKEYSQQK